MRLLVACLCLVLLGCTTETQKFSAAKVNESRILFDAIGGEGDYKTRYERIYNVPTVELCEAAMPLQSLGSTFVAMPEPGVIRWMHGGKSVRFDSETNGKLGYIRLTNMLEDETVACTKANNRTWEFLQRFPSADWECGIEAVKTVCGKDFVTYENYERLRVSAREYRDYRRKLSGPPRPDNQIECSSYTIGNSTRTRCN